MKIKQAAIGLYLLLSAAGASASMWEVGRLDYSSGSSEIAAFINLSKEVQLQNILCTRLQAHSNRFSLLLPKSTDKLSIIELEIESDGKKTSVYGEISGNSLELQVDNDIIISLSHTPNLTLIFKPSDAAVLGIDPVLNVPMQGASFANTNMASECTVQCQTNSFSCQKPLVSAILWPVDGFRSDIKDVDRLCTKGVGEKYFDLNDRCKRALDLFYEKNGRGPLSFIHALFFNENSHFKKYAILWNEAIENATSLPRLNERTFASDKEWYLILFSLLSDTKLRNYPKSYYEILELKEDPTTLIYDIDNRYEMEALKYTSVLMRRLSSVNSRKALQRALNVWNDFYRDFSAVIPAINRTKALRPVIYREMLLRIWNLAGHPKGLDIKEENIFRQGTNGQPITTELLEKSCSIFDGMQGDQFYYGSADCVEKTQVQMRNQGLINDDYNGMQDAWDNYRSTMDKSVFSSDDEMAGDNPRANLALVMLSLFKRYGFGDYFLVRECISSQDEDICYLEMQRAVQSYNQELQNKVKAISAVSQQDAKELNRLNDMFQDYQAKLEKYVDNLAARGKIARWRVNLALAVSLIAQTNHMANAPYYKEQLNDGDELISADDF